jgi:hypothetical protein
VGNENQNSGNSSGNLSAAWTIPALCLALGLIAVCVIVPQAEANKKMAVDREQLTRDLAYVNQQVVVNQTFIDSFSSDPDLTERLAQREMKQVRAGTEIISFAPPKLRRVQNPTDMLRIPRPDPVPPYVPPMGMLGTICGDDRKQLYAVALGLFAVAATLVIGAGAKAELPASGTD